MSEVNGSSQEKNYALSQGNLEQGMKVFNQAVEGYKKAGFDAQKEQYKKAISESYLVVIESAKQLGQTTINQYKTQQAHYEAFVGGNSKVDVASLQKDVESIHS